VQIALLRIILKLTVDSFLKKLSEKKDLTPEEAEAAMAKIMSGQASEEHMKRFLLGLKDKGETIEEIAAFARVLRSFAIKVNPRLKTGDILVDTCGSGGDTLKTFNVSTAAAFVAAGAGIKIAKHGNRSVSSKSGSADVLEKLGVKIDLDARGVERCIEQAGIGFMFAPLFHTAMKHVAPVRKQLATRTVFNLLGPLISPADIKHQVYGIYDPALTEKLAGVLKELGTKRALVVHGMDGLDELSTIGETKISELKTGKISTYTAMPGDFGVGMTDRDMLSGGGPEENAKIITGILNGDDAGPKRDIVSLNAAAAIYVGEGAKSIKEAVKMAEMSINSGAAAEKLKKLVEVSNA
jgi:anthranilate phosphoribosyltransferase